MPLVPRDPVALQVDTLHDAILDRCSSAVALEVEKFGLHMSDSEVYRLREKLHGVLDLVIRVAP